MQINSTGSLLIDIITVLMIITIIWHGLSFCKNVVEMNFTRDLLKRLSVRKETNPKADALLFNTNVK